VREARKKQIATWDFTNISDPSNADRGFLRISNAAKQLAKLSLIVVETSEEIGLDWDVFMQDLQTALTGYGIGTDVGLDASQYEYRSVTLNSRKDAFA
jgi:hypothetical protein